MVYKVEVFILQHRPSRRYLDMRQECRTFKSVASRPCDWLLLVLAMSQGSRSYTSKALLEDETKTTQCVIAW